ncbi:hypothetical protein CNY89_00065, partial [Amaricoccus sp. HAR-UPW-R2A-40]
IAASAPINKQAAMATGRGGEHYAPPAHRNNAISSDVMLPYRGPSREELICPDFHNLVGVSWGRSVVMGIFDHERAEVVIGSAKSRKQKWVIRCACGRFETRSSKVIRAAIPRTGHCAHCDHTEWLRNRHKRPHG